MLFRSDQGDDDGTLFLAMELIPGHTLRDTVSKEAPMSPARALALLEPVVSALAAAHRAGIVHRDVKPENVLIDPSGRALLTDFGLARDLELDARLTATGQFVGTPAYASPEQLCGKPTDPRSDVYSLGATLFEMLLHGGFPAAFRFEDTAKGIDVFPRHRLKDDAVPLLNKVDARSRLDAKQTADASRHNQLPLRCNVGGIHAMSFE